MPHSPLHNEYPVDEEVLESYVEKWDTNKEKSLQDA